ncbi:MAG: hypothetical protein ACFFCQ_15525, partial [Promethearchaeota archaeon]
MSVSSKNWFAFFSILVSIVLAFNILVLNSTIVGLGAASIYFFSIGYSISFSFTNKFSRPAKLLIGVSFVFILSLLMILGGLFLTSMVSLIVAITVISSAVLLAIYTFFSKSIRYSFRLQLMFKSRFSLVLVFSYLLSLALLLLLVFTSIDGSSPNIWASMNPLFILLFGISSILLATICIKVQSKTLALSLLVFHSILSRSLIAVIMVPLANGDTSWYNLAHTRVYELQEPSLTTIYNPIWVSQHGGNIGEIAHSIEESLRYLSNIYFSKVFCIDLLLVHRYIVPILSGVIIPICIFEISKLIGSSERSSLVSAIISLFISELLLYGAYPWANGLGVAFFALTLLLASSWLVYGQRILLFMSILSMISTILVHFIPGLFSISVILIAVGLKYRSRFGAFGKMLLITFFILGIIIFPLSFSLYYRPSGFNFGRSIIDYIVPVGEGLAKLVVGSGTLTLSLQIFVGILSIIASFLGAFLFRKKTRKSPHASFLFNLLLLMASSIFITYLLNLTVIDNPPFFPGRERVQIYLVLLPLSSIFFDRILSSVRKYSIIKIGFSSSDFKKIFKLNVKQFLILGIILVVGFGSTSSIYAAYPKNNSMWGRVTQLEYEAAQKIAYLSNSSYTGIGDFNFRLAGAGVVGYLNPKAFYFHPYNSIADYYFTEISKGNVTAMANYLDEVNTYLRENGYGTDSSNISLVFVGLSSIRYYDKSLYWLSKVVCSNVYEEVFRANDTHSNEVVIFKYPGVNQNMTVEWCDIKGEWLSTEDGFVGKSLKHNDPSFRISSVSGKKFSLRLDFSLIDQYADLAYLGIIYEYNSLKEYKTIEIWFLSNEPYLYINSRVTSNSNITMIYPWPGNKTNEPRVENQDYSLEIQYNDYEIEFFLNNV